MNDAPSAELSAALRDQTFEEIERVSHLLASYSRSTAEAAWRGDETTMRVHLKQLRLCCISLLNTYKSMEGRDARADGAG
jgi:hypothetical protein